LTNADFKHHEFEIQRDLWIVFKKYYGSDLNVNGEQCRAELTAVIVKYGRTDFACAMALAMNDQLMRRWNEMIGKGEVT